MINWIAPTLCPPNKVVYATFFDGELNIANRGLVEFIEILKLDVAFLYDLLTASQEHKIKPKKFAQTDIDEVIIGHTNEAEYRRLLNNEFMEALRDRTIDRPLRVTVCRELPLQRAHHVADVGFRRVVEQTGEVGGILEPLWGALARIPGDQARVLRDRVELPDVAPVPAEERERMRDVLDPQVLDERLRGEEPPARERLHPVAARGVLLLSHLETSCRS